MSEIRVCCPSCKSPLKAALANAGQVMKCPRCSKPFRLPAGPVTTAATKPPVPTPAKAAPSAPSKAKTERPSDPWSELNATDPSAPRSARRSPRGAKKPARKGGPALLVLGLAGGGVLLIGGVVLALVLSGVFKEKPAPPAAPNQQAARKPLPRDKAPKPADSPSKDRDTPTAAPAAAAALREQILGKWEGQDETGKGSLEFLPNGEVMLVMEGGPPTKGTYRILDGQTVEIRLALGEQVVTQKLRVKVGKDELTTTDEMDHVDHLRRSTGVAAAAPKPSAGGAPTPEAVSAAARAFFSDASFANKSVAVVSVSPPLEAPAKSKDLYNEPNLLIYAVTYRSESSVLEGVKATSKNKLIFVSSKDGKVNVLGYLSSADQIRDVLGSDWYTKEWKGKAKLDDPTIQRDGSPAPAARDTVPKPPEDRGAAVRGDLKTLQGTWTAIQGSAAGKSVAAAIAKHFKGRLVITSDKYVLTATESGESEEGTIKLNESAKPKEINLRVTKGRDKGAELLGIYAFNGEVLKVCVARPKEERPDDFVTVTGNEDAPWILLFERVKQPAGKKD